MRTKLGSLIAVGLAGAVALTACGNDNNTGTTPTASSSSNCPSGSLSGAGSSFQKNIELQWIKDYQAQCTGVTVNYNAVGSGAGITQFGAGTVDYAGSDSLMKDNEQAAADKRCGTGNAAIHIPVTAGAVILTYNLPGVTTLKLSAPTIAGIFLRKITTWNDPKIAADNVNGAVLPSTAIQPFHREDSSGTTDVISKFLDANAKGVWTLGTGKDLQWPGGGGKSGSDGVTGAVKTTPGGITYTELSFAKANSLPTAQVKGAGTEYVEATGTTVAAALGAATLDESKGDLRVKIDFATTAAGAYPVSAVTYVIVCNKANQKADLLKAFLTYATGAGQTVADSLGYAPLPGAIAGKVTAAVSALA